MRLVNNRLEDFLATPSSVPERITLKLGMKPIINRVPKTWGDLTKPEYKGEIQSANPASSGTANTAARGRACGNGGTGAGHRCAAREGGMMASAGFGAWGPRCTARRTAP